MIQSTIRRPRIGCKCFGTAERIRVPRPPAITTEASGVSFTAERLETRLGRQDSNLGSRDQNPLPYRLATPQNRRRILRTVGEDEEERNDREQRDDADRER